MGFQVFAHVAPTLTVLLMFGRADMEVQSHKAQTDPSKDAGIRRLWTMASRFLSLTTRIHTTKLVCWSPVTPMGYRRPTYEQRTWLPLWSQSWPRGQPWVVAPSRSWIQRKNAVAFRGCFHEGSGLTDWGLNGLKIIISLLLLRFIVS